MDINNIVNSTRMRNARLLDDINNKILNREYSASLEAEKEIKKDADNYELKQKELVKEKILKEITENKSQQNNE